MEAFGILGPLPAGWDCKLESKYGKLYFINHTNKTTTWEDPRLISIPTPPYHIAITQPSAYFEDNVGSRWSSPVPSVRGFLLNRRGSSPRLGGSPKIAPSPTPPPRNKRNEQVILDSTGRGVTSILHQGNSSYPHHNQFHVQLQDGRPSVEPILERPPSARSFASSNYNVIPSSHLISCDTETAYRTVCALFPTATEPHVRHLFHKYHNRANVVVSALQVEKHPIVSDIAHQIEVSVKELGGKDGDTDTVLSMPDTKSIGINSPFKGNSFVTDSPVRTGTPGSLMKYSNNQSSVGSLFTKSWGSPIMSMSPQMQMVKESSKPPKSPKMKLKYLKGIFPAADETVLLDVLHSCENNIQKASERMLRKGFTRTPPPKPARQKWLEVKSLIEKRQKALDQQRIVNFHHEIRGEPQESPFPTPIMKSVRPHPSSKERADARTFLLSKFPNHPERFLSWALEASHFSKEKAERLLREIGPQTPEEFKPFISEAVEETVKPKELLTRKSLTDAVDSAVLNNNVEEGTSKKSSPGDAKTPDSGYFELGPKPRKKNFFSSIFSMKPKGDKVPFGSKKAKGPNSQLAKGPNPGLLKPNYIQVLGPSKSKSRGSNPAFRQGSQCQAQGPNPTLAKGPFWCRNRPTVTVTVEG